MFRMPQMPRFALPILCVALIIALIPVVLIAKARAQRSPTPRIHLIQDMDNQPKYKAQAFNPLFADKRAMRPRIPGTVSRSAIINNEVFLTGKENGAWVNDIPVEITDQVLVRGQERFQIFCAPCHGISGYGNGMINQRAELLQEGTWVPPLSFHDAQVRMRPNGHLFNTITHGIRNMPPYASQIEPYDRWAIVAFVRALQLSQNASLEDVPPEIRADLP
jgi:mono/diheme cytochrome c family protein